jgi:hypothetical protein
MAPMRDASRSVLRICVVALVFSLISACASSPQRAPQPQPALSGKQLEVGGTSAPAQPPAVDPSQIDIAMRKRGYQPATVRGERVYCRKEPLTGSNLESKVCRTAKEIDDQERAGKDVLNQNRPAGCLPRSGCN